jgi:fido (protein-threonine AMPylation protein)
MKVFNNKKLILPPAEEVTKFLLESNAIEGVFGDEALEDAEKAWKYTLSYGVTERPDYLDYKVLLHMHKLLMKRLNPRIAGKFREVDVYIGEQKKGYHGVEVLKSELRDLFSTMHGNNFIEGKAEEFTRHCHVMYEDIHPFEDGNGRTGRILYNWQRLNMGLPLHIIHSGDEQQEYYKWFKKDV